MAQKYLISQLELCYPPVTNQEAEWLKDDPDVQQAIKVSNIYMICQKTKVIFQFDDASEKIISSKRINFTIMNADFSAKGAIDLVEIIRRVNLDAFDLDWELGPHLIRISTIDKKTKERVIIDWFTTEKLLFDRSKGHPAILFLDNYRDFLEYKLHYVGISKSDDSLTRLVIKPHDTRLRILSNESSFQKGARLTDEVILLFFRINRLEIQVFDEISEESIPEMLNSFVSNDKALFTDAEKAFVNILKSKYNSIKYQNYPKGIDGLYNSGILRYGYNIADDITLVTDKIKMRGGDIYSGNPVDIIAIYDDKVTFLEAN